jgi:hypothetical protein
MKIYAILESVHFGKGEPIAYLSTLEKAIDYIKANINMEHPNVSEEIDSCYWHNIYLDDENEMFEEKGIENRRFYTDNGVTALKICSIPVE